MRVKCCEGRGSKDISLSCHLTELGGVECVFQSAEWVPGPWSSRDLVFLGCCRGLQRLWVQC